MESEFKQLADKLEQFQCVKRFDSQDESESCRLAHSIVDLSGSFRSLLEIEFPKLKKAASEQAVHDALLDIREELRHVLYHIRDPKFLSCLFDE